MLLLRFDLSGLPTKSLSTQLFLKFVNTYLRFNVPSFNPPQEELWLRVEISGLWLYLMRI